ncbi:IMPACT family protein [Gilvibacter sediminis]|uniref:IMPACT family protein n=1 Tax=Gilvibacter sediminis TaxID=379071 RepID=UPI002350F057|nr:YigZ family protein [Gilvibacter sediminis]MDC7997834.1 YigZ family protein [Gilvibacter sediminis]
MEDQYKTIKAPSSPQIFKDRGSKFLGYAFPLSAVEEVAEHIETLKKEHHTARHWCYAYQLGVSQPQYRANDDGEPANSAGAPIYGQIQAFELTDVLVVVVRYFGGTKLGIGGLINAYRTGAKLALEASEIETRYIETPFVIKTPYNLLGRIMRLIDEEGITIISQESAQDVSLHLQVRSSRISRVENAVKKLYPAQFIPTN